MRCREAVEPLQEGSCHNHHKYLDGLDDDELGYVGISCILHRYRCVLRVYGMVCRTHCASGASSLTVLL
jgi:hypothetical protein